MGHKLWDLEALPSVLLPVIMQPFPLLCARLTTLPPLQAPHSDCQPVSPLPPPPDSCIAGASDAAVVVAFQVCKRARPIVHAAKCYSSSLWCAAKLIMSSAKT